MKVYEIQNKMIELQKKYNIGLVAVTYRGVSSFYAEPKHFPKKWFLSGKIPEEWSEVGSRIIFKNAYNGSGGLKMRDEYKKKLQYISYQYIERSTLIKFLEELTEYINAYSEIKYQLEVPEDKYLCATLEAVD